MSTKSSITIRVPSSHLYRGMRLHTEGAQHLQLPMSGADSETEILLFFSDNSTVPSRLRTDTSGDPILCVESYMTAQGTDIPRKTWRIKSLDAHGTEWEIWLGIPMSTP